MPKIWRRVLYTVFGMQLFGPDDTFSGSEIRPVEQPETITTRTYWELRRALLHRAIKPGERLLETRLAEQLGVSRTPVRETLARLVAEGLAEEIPGSRGVVVRDFRQELHDIYGLRQVLEGYAARLAADRISPEELETLEELSCQIGVRIREGNEDESSLKTHAELSNAFHLQITQASRDPRLIRMIANYRDYFLTSDFLRLYDRELGSKFQAQHEAIIAALRARDGEAAERLVRLHFADAAAVIDVHMEAVETPGERPVQDRGDMAQP